MNIVDAIRNTEKSVTENGAIGYKSSGNRIVDINFKVPQIRTNAQDGHDLENFELFSKALDENKEYAYVWLFFLRDIRGGIGERASFRSIFKSIIETDVNMALKLIDLIPEYGRYDDMIYMLGIDYRIDNHIYNYIACKLDHDIKNCDNGKPVSLLAKLPSINVLGIDYRIDNHIYNYIACKLEDDINNCDNGKHVSLLAKWLPSINATSARTRKTALNICNHIFNGNKKEYRQLLSKLRKAIDVVEKKMSANEWDKIKYENVPSYANLRYKNAFINHDKERREEYLDKLNKGETTINAKTLFPYDIIHKYRKCYYSTDDVLESLWERLPSFNMSNTIIMRDGSSSMTCGIGNSSVSAMDVGDSITLYASEHSKGLFANKFITFSSYPQLVELPSNSNLCQKLQILDKYDDCSTTNIDIAFDLLLNAAVENKLDQKDIPDILIISDMEFDYQCDNCDKALMNYISDKWTNAGYKMPKLIFWNVNSRTSTVPIQQNELGIILISGFSLSLFNMVMSNKLDPWEALKDQLDSPRYDLVREAMK